MTEIPENPTRAAWAVDPEEVFLPTDVVDRDDDVSVDPEPGITIVVAEADEPEADEADEDAEPPVELENLEDLRVELQAERVRVAERAASLEPLLERATQHREELEVLRGALAEKEHEIDGLRADLAAARTQVTFERERLGAEIERVRTETADEREHIVVTKERLRTEIERLRRDRVWLDGELQQLAVERRRLEVLSASLDDLHARLQADRAKVIGDLARLGTYPAPAHTEQEDVSDPDEDPAL